DALHAVHINRRPGQTVPVIPGARGPRGGSHRVDVVRARAPEGIGEDGVADIDVVPRQAVPLHRRTAATHRLYLGAAPTPHPVPREGRVGLHFAPAHAVIMQQLLAETGDVDVVVAAAPHRVQHLDTVSDGHRVPRRAVVVHDLALLADCVHVTRRCAPHIVQ